MKAFVASGGGAKGQYTVGAMQHLFRDVGRRYDLYAGTSIGAYLCAFAAQYATGEEAALVDDITKLGLSIKRGDVYRNWFPFGWLHGLWKSSVYDSKPLQQLVQRTIDPQKIAASGKLLRLGATRLAGGEDPYIVFSERSRDLREALIASMALSPGLAAVRLADGLYVDGGFQVATPIAAAIDAGATSIDVVVCYPEKMQGFSYGRRLNALEVSLRELDLVTHKLVWNEVKQTLRINQLVQAGLAPQKRYVELTVIRPESELHVGSLEFERQTAERLHALGRADAERIVAAVPHTPL